MILDMSTIEFESRNEIQEVLNVLETWKNTQKKPSKTIDELIDKLEVMYLSW